MSEQNTDSVETTEVSEGQVVANSTLSDDSATPSEETSKETEQPVKEAKNEEAAPELSKINPEDLPDDMKQVYKNMQAAFTKDRQAISELKKKAQMYDQQQQEDILQSKFPEQPEKAQEETTDYLAEALGVDVRSLEKDQQQQLEQLAKIVDAAVSKRITEQIQPIQNDLLTRDYQQELGIVRKKYSDFNDYLPEIKQLLSDNKQLSYEQAYRLASYEGQSKKGRTEAMKNLEVKTKRSLPKTTVSAKESDNPKGFENIFTWAQQKINS